MESSLNNINWENITLYHGTNRVYLKSILDNGFFTPQHEKNWLGKGTYFSVNNIFMPILYSNNHVKNYFKKNEKEVKPAILKIKGSSLSNNIKNKILDSTVQNGLNILHNITTEFSSFLNPYNGKEKIQNRFELLEAHFSNSPLYSNDLQSNLIPNIDWLSFAISSSKTIKEFKSHNDSRLKNLNTISDNNISNILFAWFNYKYSCGIEEQIPIRGIMGHFNTGTPISLENIFKSKKIERGFSDYISYLNRTELSIFGYNYYSNKNNAWGFNELFENKNPKKGEKADYNTYEDRDAIIGLLEDSFLKNDELNFKNRKTDFIALYDLLISEYDTN